ncbi:ROK family protein [Lachnoclostridium sp. Marseille-P6806]|uniref:ROK family protein n=1 Tax=Lachnoclostridium sp. Marseille-P6806 TaxID=2364793 RepID=UPI0010323C0B|nr:ROK family protein [Lachnoclostridium sp. Marseille-P6806]
MGRYIAIDIGGTAIKYGILGEDGRILARHETPTESERGGAAIQKKVLELIASMKDETIRGVAISSAGIVDVENGNIGDAGPTIPEYSGVEFRRPVEERFGIPCEIENDVNCAGLAEYYAGAGRGASSLLCLTVGTGIGGCAILGGKVWRGFTGGACEVGYMHMEGSSFEELGAASVLAKRVAERRGEAAENWDGRRVFEEAKCGDRICIGAIDEMCRILGEGIANTCYVLNPEVVVLGGGIMAQKEMLYPKLRRSLDDALIPSMAEHTALRMAENGNSAGMLGAYYHFIGRRTE